MSSVHFSVLTHPFFNAKQIRSQDDSKLKFPYYTRINHPFEKELIFNEKRAESSKSNSRSNEEPKDDSTVQQRLEEGEEDAQNHGDVKPQRRSPWSKMSSLFSESAAKTESKKTTASDVEAQDEEQGRRET